MSRELTRFYVQPHFSVSSFLLAQLLKYVTTLMTEAKAHQAPGAGSNVPISQLVLVMSDGRGLFLEGIEKVKSAVRAARDANIFLVFLVLDNPENKVRKKHIPDLLPPTRNLSSPDKHVFFPP